MCGGGGERGGRRGYAGKVVDIQRRTKNPNPRSFYFSFFVSEGEGRLGDCSAGEVLAGAWEQLFSYVTQCTGVLKFCPFAIDVRCS